jgi:ketopantoate reductase
MLVGKLQMLVGQEVVNADLVVRDVRGGELEVHLQSLEAGEITEINILNGFFVENGLKYGVPTPVNTKLVEMIHEIERGERKMSSDNLSEF